MASSMNYIRNAAQAMRGQEGRPQPSRPQPSRPDRAVRYPEMEDDDDFEFMDLDD